MIQLITGVPGSGKSCYLSKQICTWLKNGQYVLANFDFDAEPWGEYFVRIPDYPTLDEVQGAVLALPRMHREHNAILCIDEAQRCFNSRTWNDKQQNRLGFVKFFTLSRHLGLDVILVAQLAEMVDKQIRACAQTEMRFMRVSAMGAIPFVISLFGRLPLCFWAEHYYGTRVRVASGFFLPRAKWWSRYDSYNVDFLADPSLAEAVYTR